MTQQDEIQKVYVAMPEKKTNGVGMAGFILSLIALFMGWLPVIGWLVWGLGALLSFVGLFKSPRGFAIAGLLVSFIGLLVIVFAAAFFTSL